MVLNYIGPEYNQGIQVYFDGVKRDEPGEKLSSIGQIPKDGTVFIGRLPVYHWTFYGTLIMDELMFFNEKLTEDQIQQLYQQGLP